MQLTRDEVVKIAKLARIKLTEAQIEKFQKDLSGIVQYVSLLNEVNTDGVEPTAQVTGLSNVTRPDQIFATPLAAPDDLLACSPLYDEQKRAIKVPGVFN